MMTEKFSIAYNKSVRYSNSELKIQTGTNLSGVKYSILLMDGTPVRSGTVSGYLNEFILSTRGLKPGDYLLIIGDEKMSFTVEDFEK